MQLFLQQGQKAETRERSAFGLKPIVPRVLFLCAALLALPSIADAQPIPLAVQSVWTQDPSGNAKTAFAPGEPIQFAAQLSNSYGGTLPSSDLSISTSFYTNDKRVDIPPGVSTWTWNTTVPAAPGSFTVTVKAYDSFYGAWPSGNAKFSLAIGYDDYPISIRRPTPQDAVSDPWRFLNRECVSFVAWRLNSAYGFNSFRNDLVTAWPDLASYGKNPGELAFGNALDWTGDYDYGAYGGAKRFGIPVDGNPAPRTVAWWGRA
jgi:hypothetical protein